MGCEKLIKMFNNNSGAVASEVVKKYMQLGGLGDDPDAGSKVFASALDDAINAEKAVKSALVATTMTEIGSEGKMNPTKALSKVDQFIDYVSGGVFNNMTELERSTSESADEYILSRLKSLSGAVVGMLSTKDYEHLKETDLAVSSMSQVRSVIGLAMSEKKAMDLAESWPMKVLRMSMFDSDRSRIFASNPLLVGAYKAKKELSSMIQSAANYGLEMKTSLVAESKSFGLTEEDLGGIISTIEKVGDDLLSVKRAYEVAEDKAGLPEPPTTDMALRDIKSALDSKFPDIQDKDNLFNSALSLWRKYRAFNYGSAINDTDDLFDLPEGYRPMDPRFKDGYLPRVVTMNVTRENWIKNMQANGNLSLDAPLIREVTTISKHFTPDANGNIEWKWMKNYFPHHSEFDTFSLKQDKVDVQKVATSLDDANAFYSRTIKNYNGDAEFSNDLEATIQNMRYRSNLAIDKLFTSYLVGVSGYDGGDIQLEGISPAGNARPEYDRWATANPAYPSSIKGYIDGMAKRFSKQKTKNVKSLRVGRKVAVGLLSMQAAMPLSSSSVANIIGAVSAGVGELGLGNAFSMSNNWRKEHSAGSIEAEVQQMIKNGMDKNLGVKAIRFAEEDTVIDQVGYNALEKSLDYLASGMIKTGEHVMRHGMLAPATAALTLMKPFILGSMKASSAIGFGSKEFAAKTAGSLDSFMEKTADTKLFSMSGSEQMLLQVQSMYEYDSVMRAVKLKNNSLAMSGKKELAPKSKELEQFVNQYRDNSLFSKDSFEKWRNIVGDFTEDTKPFWAWATLRDADSLPEIMLGATATSYYMFRQVGLFLTQNTARAISRTATGSGTMSNNGYALAMAALTLWDLTTESEGGVQLPLTAQVSPVGAILDPAKALARMTSHVLMGTNISESEYEQHKMAISRSVGGMPFGGTIQQFWDGFEKNNSALDGAKNILKDALDPVFLIQSVTEQLHWDAEDLDLVPQLKAEYKSNGIPVLQQMISQNKTMDRMISIGGMATKSATAFTTDDTTMQNKLNYSISQDWMKLALGMFNLMPFVSKPVDDVATGLSSMVSKNKDGDSRAEFLKMLGDLK